MRNSNRNISSWLTSSRDFNIAILSITNHVISLKYPSSFERLDHCFGLFVSFSILSYFLFICHVFFFLFVCVFLFVHVVGVRELTLLFSHLQRQRNPKKVLQNSYNTLLSGLRPYSPPYLSGDRYAPRHLSQPHSASRRVAESPPTLTHRHPNSNNRRIHSTGLQRKALSGAFCMDVLCI